MAERASEFPFVNSLVMDFPFFLKYYMDHCPFTKFGQLEYHLATIQRRRVGVQEALRTGLSGPLDPPVHDTAAVTETSMLCRAIEPDASRGVL